MPDTLRTLSALQTLLADNTAGDISPQDVRDMLVSTYQLDYSADVAVTGAVTATIGKWHICSGTSADYTVTLPAASGNAGKLIGLRMSSALTKLVTIDANSTELIDGVETRVMWANEVAVLFCDGTGWTKIGGKSIPMVAGIYRASNQTSVTAASIEKVLCSTLDFDDTGFVADATNSRLTVKRTSSYIISGKVQGDGPGALARWISLLYVNGAQAGSGETNSVSGTYPTPAATRTQTITAGHNVELYVYFSGSAAKNVVGSSGKESQISIAEIVSW